MSRDDYDDRQRDSNDYLRRQQETLAFEEMLARRHDTVYKAIGEREPLRTASGAGCAPSDSSGIKIYDSRVFEARNKPQTVYEQWLKHKTRLIIKLESSNFLSAKVTRQWIRKIKRLDIFKPSRGLEELDELFTDYSNVVDQYKPQRGDMDMTVAKAIEFNNEIHDIIHDLDWLKTLLKHVEV